MSKSQEAERIRREMEQVRDDLDYSMETIVENAKVMADWRYFVRTYPWVCMGAAATVGYLVVPHRYHVIRPDAKTLARLARKEQLVVEPTSEPHRRPGLVGSLFNLAANAAVRAAIAYMGQQAGKMINERAAHASGNGPA